MLFLQNKTFARLQGCKLLLEVSPNRRFHFDAKCWHILNCILVLWFLFLGNPRAFFIETGVGSLFVSLSQLGHVVAGFTSHLVALLHWIIFIPLVIFLNLPKDCLQHWVVEGDAKELGSIKPGIKTIGFVSNVYQKMLKIKWQHSLWHGAISSKENTPSHEF